MSMRLNYVDTGAADFFGQGRLLPQERGEYNGRDGLRHPLRSLCSLLTQQKKLIPKNKFFQFTAIETGEIMPPFSPRMRYIPVVSRILNL